MPGLSKEEIELASALRIRGKSVPFCEHIGVKYELPDRDDLRLTLAMRDELVGNEKSGVLHGGVVCAILDMIGGATIAWKLRNTVKGMPVQEGAKKLGSVSTVDLRVDYLRRGRGSLFTATASVLRIGKKVAVARMELHNEKQELIAAGTGTFTTG
jgi:uncharacterized protein (TIGR00369 family)